MLKIAWITDSSACIDEELQHHPDVYVVPITIILDNQEYRDGVDLTPYELYNKLKSSTSQPKTSQPSVGQFLALYEKLQYSYDYIISIHVSSKLSGTYSSSFQAAQQIQKPIYVIDSKVTSYPMTALISEGIRLNRAGTEINDILSSIQKLVDKNKMYVIVGSLEQLYASGRLNSIQFVVGSLLKIKPIITFNNGTLAIYDKVRTERKALLRFLTILKEEIQNSKISEVYLLYGLHSDKAQVLKQKIESLFPSLNVLTFPFSTSLGVHTGEDTIGISWFNN
ncbi:DegV family protein [Cytobacillus sp. Hm23]